MTAQHFAFFANWSLNALAIVALFACAVHWGGW